jgi:hypothetical protein
MHEVNAGQCFATGCNDRPISLLLACELIGSMAAGVFGRKSLLSCLCQAQPCWFLTLLVPRSRLQSLPQTQHTPNLPPILCPP